MAKLLRLHSLTAWTGLTGEQKYRAFPSLLLAATGLLEGNILPLLQTELVQESRKFKWFANFGLWQLMWNEIFNAIGENLLLTKAVLIALLNLSTIYWGLSKEWHRNEAACSKLNPVQSTRSKLSKKRESAWILIEQHSNFRWRNTEDWKQCLAWFWINHNQNLQPNLLQINWKPCRDQHWQYELPFSILRLFEQSACVNNHLLSY